MSLDADFVGEDSQLAKFAGTRHESPQAFAARIHAWANTWKCLGPGCRNYRFEGCSWWMFCSDSCREKSLEHERGRSKTK